jgi:predicted DNA-binding transcriptional regulator YafY
MLAPQLDEAEVALLADALDNAADVRIAYRNRSGNRSVRTIRPDGSADGDGSPRGGFVGPVP